MERWRPGLYAGLFGALGVAAGWLGFFLMNAGWAEVIGGAFVGALVAGVGEWMHRYRHIAIEEHDEPWLTPKRGNHKTRPKPRVNWAAMSSVFGAFLLATALHAVGHLMQAMWKPVLASWVLLFPIGMLFGWMLQSSIADWARSDFFRCIFVGVVAGFFAGLLSCGLGGLVTRGAFDSFTANVGWWMLVGNGITGAIHIQRNRKQEPRRRPTPEAGETSSGPRRWRAHWLTPVIGVLFAFAMLIGACTYSLRGTMMDSLWERLAGCCVDAIFTAPGVPARYWSQALEASKEGSDETTAQTPQWLPRLFGCNEGTGSSLAFTDQATRERHDALCRELKQGWHSGLLASFWVMFSFAFGLSIAGRLETEYQPGDYEHSRTRRNDILFARVAAALWVAAVVVLITF